MQSMFSIPENVLSSRTHLAHSGWGSCIAPTRALIISRRQFLRELYDPQRCVHAASCIQISLFAFFPKSLAMLKRERSPSNKDAGKIWMVLYNIAWRIPGFLLEAWCRLPIAGCYGERACPTRVTKGQQFFAPSDWAG